MNNCHRCLTAYMVLMIGESSDMCKSLCSADPYCRVHALLDIFSPHTTGAKDAEDVKFPEWMIDRVRVFHPTVEGHKLIRKAIMRKMKEIAGHQEL